MKETVFSQLHSYGLAYTIKWRASIQPVVFDRSQTAGFIRDLCRLV